jgi:hypothetical protein
MMLWVVPLVLPVVALASTIIPHTLSDRARSADRVAVVQVTKQWVEDEGDAQRPRLKTYTRVIFGAELKGSGPRETTIVQLGGRSGLWDMRVPGDATFSVGETALVFLKCASPDRCYLVALGEGRLPIVESDVYYRDLFTDTWVRQPLTALFAQLAQGGVGPAVPAVVTP